MITVKAFDKGLICNGFQYEVGKTYELPTEKVEICKYGFHTSAHCDLSETLDYYPDVANNEYALVDINVVDSTDDKVVGDKITIIKKLETLDELIIYDKTGEWCYEFAKNTNDMNTIKQLQDTIIKNDRTGEMSYRFAKDIKGADIEQLQNSVIEKDKDGRWCYRFANHVKGANIKRLENAVMQKDSSGEWCYHFAKSVKNANTKHLENAVIEKDPSGMWCCNFAKDVKGADTSKLQQAVIQKDKTGLWCYQFARFIKGADISKLQQEVIKKDQSGQWCTWFASGVKDADIKELEDAVIKKDSSGEWCYHFARDVRGADIERLQSEVIKKDESGEWCYWFARLVEGKADNEMFYKTRDNLNNYQDDVYKAIAFLYLNVFTFGGRIRSASWSFNNVKNKNKMNVFLNKKDLLDLYHQKLKHIQIEHCDFRKCFDLYVKKWNENNLDYLVYLDPPYILSTRTGKLYNHEFSDNDHKDMIDLILKYNKGKYIVSGYDNDIYKELENNGFKKYCFNVVNRSGENNKKRKTLTECIWVNFDITKGGLL